MTMVVGLDLSRGIKWHLKLNRSDMINIKVRESIDLIFIWFIFRLFMNLDFSFSAELLIIHLAIYSFIIFIFLKIRRKIIYKRLVERYSFDREQNQGYFSIA